MSHPSFGTAFRHWLHRMSEPAASQTSDAQLLDRYIHQRDETAFAALVQRHGSLVLGICRGILRDVHDAEDAFQATFLVLACRAGAIRRTASLTSFLHGTAYRIAKRLRVQKAQRQIRLRQTAFQRSEPATASPEDRETHALLHEELARLPRKYRDALVLCYLQGKTNEQAARELGYPPGSMSRHLHRARELLRDRLLGRGVGAALAASLLNEPASAAVSASLVRGTLDLVRRHALAAALLAGSTPPAAVMLAQAVLRSASVGRITLISAMLTLGVVLAGGVAAWQTPDNPQARSAIDGKRPLPALPASPRVDLYGDPLPEGALARMGTARLRHAMATQLVFAADGKTLISAGGDHTVRFWDVASGKQQRMLRLPQTQHVEAFSADGKTLALSSDAQLHLWDIAAAKEIQRIETGKLVEEKRLYAVEFSSDGKLLAAGNLDGTVVVWDAIGGKERGQFKHPDRQVQTLAFSPDGKRLAAAGSQHVLLWDLASGREFRTITDKRLSPNNRLIFSPDGKLLAAASYGQAILWDAATGKEEAVLQFESMEKRSTNDVAFSSDGQTVAIRGGETFVLWDRSIHKEKKRWKSAYNSISYPGRLIFSSDGKLLAGLRSGEISLWDTSTGKPLHDRPSHSSWVGAVALSPDGNYLASASNGDRTVRLWDAHTGKPLHAWPMSYPRTYPVVFTPDGANVIAAGLWGECRMWDVRSGELRHIFHVGEEPQKRDDLVPAVHLSPDGKRLAALSIRSEVKNGVRRFYRYLTTWNVRSGKRIDRHRLSLEARTYLHVEQFSPNGKLAITLDLTGVIFDVAADHTVRTLPRDLLTSPVAFSPDSRLLALGSSAFSTTPQAETVRLMDIASGDVVLTLATGPVGGRAFSPDGRYLLTAGDSGLRLWELATGKEVLHRRAEGILGYSTHNPCLLAFAADSRSVATGMSDPNVLIWDLAPATRQPRRLNPADRDRLWIELAGEDAPRAYQAIGTLIADSQRAVPFLRDRLKPVKEDAPRIRRLIADLDSEQFAVRDAARKELEQMDDAAHAVLRQELPKAKSLEQRRRIENLLKVGWLVQSPQKLRQIRAIAVLEQISNAETRQILERLAAGSSEARQTREAKAALQRLQRGR